MRKDLSLLTSGSFFFIIIAVMLSVAFLSAYDTSASFSRSVEYYENLLSDQELTGMKNESLFDFWTLTLFLWPITVAVLAAMSIAQENEGGMLSYLLTYRPRSWLVYLSKFLILSAVIALVCVASALIFNATFYFLSGETADWASVLGSAVFPMFGLIILSQLCMAIALLSRKKGFAPVTAICVMFLLTGVSNVAESDGLKQVMDGDFSSERSALFPVWDKVLVMLNPMFLDEGTVSVLGLENDYNSGIFYSGYFQLLTPGEYPIYIIGAILLLMAIGIALIQRQMPSRDRMQQA